MGNVFKRSYNIMTFYELIYKENIHIFTEIQEVIEIYSTFGIAPVLCCISNYKRNS